MRKRKSFERPEGVRSGRLVVIAAEGKETENIYFEQMKVSFHASGVRCESNQALFTSGVRPCPVS